MSRSIFILGGGLLAAMFFVAQQASAQPGGSYMQSCRRIEQHGPFLHALCKDMDGRWRPARIDLRYCNAPVANSDGRLTCG
jgi:CVNH domain